MKRFCLLLVLAALVRPVFSQDIVVPLERKQARTLEYIGMSIEVPTSLVKTIQDWKGIPAGLREYAIKWTSFHAAQSYFERYLNGTLPKSDFLQRIQLSKIDTLKLSRTPIQDEVYFLVGATATGKRLVIVDANANQDFSDDQRIEFTPGFTKNQQIDSVLFQAPIIKARYELFDGERIQRRTAVFRTKIYNQNYTFRDSLETKWFLSLRSVYNRTGQFTADQESYRIILNTQFDDEVVGSWKPSFELKKSTSEGVWYQLGDTLLLGRQEYVFASVEPGNTSLLLKHLRHVERPVGFSESQYAHGVAQLTLDGKPFSLEALKGKYVLLDFWGTWCGPCVKMIPELKALNERFKDKNLVLVSVAYEEKPEPVQKMALAKGMNWTHLFVSNKNSPKGNPVDQFRINCFPTTILIDPEGKIVVRGCGEEHLKRAVAILEQNR